MIVESRKLQVYRVLPVMLLGPSGCSLRYKFQEIQQFLKTNFSFFLSFRHGADADVLIICLDCHITDQIAYVEFKLLVICGLPKI